MQELFCVTLHTGYSHDLQKKFQIASTYNANVEYQMWIFCYFFLLARYSDYADTHTQRERDRSNAKNGIFGLGGLQNM